jgi:YidC/Oxa1 family membrane protein insertase
LSALRFLLESIHAVVGSYGLAVILLAIGVRLLLRPLSRVAQRWQREVNTTRSELEPAVRHIRATARGPERSARLLALYRERGVSPFYGLKSLLGPCVQIPVLLAACSLLVGHPAFSGAGFLWIEDLAAPDQLATLPFAIPLLGDGLHGLPIVMTAASLAAAWFHDDGGLSAELLARQRRALCLVALGLFAMLYRFPASVVLYWTANNLAGLAATLLGRRNGGGRHSRARLEPCAYS